MLCFPFGRNEAQKGSGVRTLFVIFNLHTNKIQKWVKSIWILLNVITTACGTQHSRLSTQSSFDLHLALCGCFHPKRCNSVLLSLVCKLWTFECWTFACYPPMNYLFFCLVNCSKTKPEWMICVPTMHIPCNEYIHRSSDHSKKKNKTKKRLPKEWWWTREKKPF